MVKTVSHEEAAKIYEARADRFREELEAEREFARNLLDGTWPNPRSSPSPRAVLHELCDGEWRPLAGITAGVGSGCCSREVMVVLDWLERVGAIVSDEVTGGKWHFRALPVSVDVLGITDAAGPAQPADPRDRLDFIRRNAARTIRNDIAKASNGILTSGRHTFVEAAKLAVDVYSAIWDRSEGKG